MPILLALLATATVATAPAYKAPRNAFGQPDFEGTWTNASLTSLERPANFKSLTIPEPQAQAAEAARARMMAAGNRPIDPKEGAPPKADDPGGYGVVWIDPGAKYGRIGGEVRTSWLVEPADGKLPYSAAGKALFDKTLFSARNNFDGPEGRPLGERCILGFGSSAGPPMLNVLYNNNYQIQQARDYVVIVVEMNHDARMIRLTDKQHPKEAIRTWMGDSIGWWEGDTLVVETTNFNPQESLRPYFGASLFLSPDAKVTERFTRTSKTQILYEFKVDDPKVFTQPWRAQMALNETKGPMYEYACHEGNYALPGILAGARRTEKNGGKTEAVDISER
jgi:hypothetical protein